MNHINMSGWNAERRIDGIREFVSKLAKIANEKNSAGRMARLRSGLILLEECLKCPTEPNKSAIELINDIW